MVKVRFSSQFIEFLAQWLDYGAFGINDWSDQVTERLRSNKDNNDAAAFRIERLATNEIAQGKMQQVEEIYLGLLSGRLSAIPEFVRQSKFVCVVGAPRSGGTYLTAEMYKALGHDVSTIPTFLAHDGVPDARPFILRSNLNTFVSTTFSFAEYLVALSIFFKDSPQRFLPKKITKAVYEGGLFRSVFGVNAEYLVTVRNPVASCISMYEKSGGLQDKKVARSAIEKWVRRDILTHGFKSVEAESSYFANYLSYWEQYHIRLVTSGLLARRVSRVVAYIPERFEELSAEFRLRVESDQAASAFFSTGQKWDRHPEWRDAALQGINRVSAAWASFGMEFPIEQVLECY